MAREEVYGLNRTEINLEILNDITPSEATEQRKIGGFFSELDNLITLHQREYFLFDFSGESAKTAQNTLSWEQRKLGDVFVEYSEKGHDEYALALTNYSGDKDYP